MSTGATFGSGKTRATTPVPSCSVSEARLLLPLQAELLVLALGQGRWVEHVHRPRRSTGRRVSRIRVQKKKYGCQEGVELRLRRIQTHLDRPERTSRLHQDSSRCRTLLVRDLAVTLVVPLRNSVVHRRQSSQASDDLCTGRSGPADVTHRAVGREADELTLGGRRPRPRGRRRSPERPERGSTSSRQDGEQQEDGQSCSERRSSPTGCAAARRTQRCGHGLKAPSGSCDEHLPE